MGTVYLILTGLQSHKLIQFIIALLSQLSITMFVKSSLLVLTAIVLAAMVQGKPQATADCFTDGFAYGGEDILTAGWHNIQPSPEACQTSCQAITDCRFFTFFKSGDSEGYCELKYDDGGIPVPEAVSGPRECP